VTAAPLRVLQHVSRALAAGNPVVALESSVFAQGLPIPQNADAATRMLAAVGGTGAIPAITAVVAGVPAVGLEAAELELLLRGEGVVKVSARDLGPAIARRQHGATTVAAAIALSSRAGIRTFATGGIGGVHRWMGGSAVWDESADLHELAHTPVIVVCAGAKSILDLQATWERLDTLGVPVIGVGTDEFPGFLTAKTGIRLSVSVQSAAEVAAIATAHFALGRQQAVLVVQPPPADVAVDRGQLDEAVAAALQRAAERDVRGSAVTPFLLAEVGRITGGRTLEANLALLESNARLAGGIAVALASTGGRA
jgi:pseudouridine-5'-phosphate glycosidase